MQVKDWHCCFTLIEYQHFKVKSRLKVPATGTVPGKKWVNFDRNFLRNIGIQSLTLTFFFLNSRQTHSNLLHWSLHHCGQLQTGCPFSYKSWSPDEKRKNELNWCFILQSNTPLLIILCEDKLLWIQKQLIHQLHLDLVHVSVSASLTLQAISPLLAMRILSKVCGRK